MPSNPETSANDISSDIPAWMLLEAVALLELQDILTDGTALLFDEAASISEKKKLLNFF